MARQVMRTAGGVTGTRQQVNDAFEGGMGVDPRQYFDPALINQFFNLSAGNLGQRMATARGRAQSDAGAMAGARGLLNPSGFTLAAGSQAASPFVSALQNLEAQRPLALSQNNAALFNALLSIQNMNQQLRAQEPDWMDFMGLILGAGGQLGSAYLGRKL